MRTTKKPNVIITAMILSFLTMLFIVGCNKLIGQEQVGFTVLNDIKLALGADDKYGNDKPTADFVFMLNLQGNQYKDYYFSLNPLFEYANLHGGKYYRYGINANWNFNNLVIDKATLSAGLGLHMINRENQYGRGTWSTSFDLSYEIIKHLSLVMHNEWVKRVDLPNKKLGYNLSVGVKYK